MIRYITLLAATLVLTVSCSGGSDTKTAQVPTPVIKATPSWNLAPQGINDELESKADDIGFVKTIIEGLSKYQPVDSSKVLGIGYSNGTGMEYTKAQKAGSYLPWMGPRIFP